MTGVIDSTLRWKRSVSNWALEMHLSFPFPVVGAGLQSQDTLPKHLVHIDTRARNAHAMPSCSDSVCCLVCKRR